MLLNVSNLFVASIFAIAAVGSHIHRAEAADSLVGDAVDALSDKGLANLEAWVHSHPPAGHCTLANAIVRREW